MKKILVIGGNSGIGEAVVERLEIQHPDAEITVPFVEEFDVKGHSGPHYTHKRYELDVRSKTVIHQFFLTHGPYTHIVYTPGVNNLAMTEDLSEANFHEDFAVNAFGFALVLGEHAKMYGKQTLKSAVAITSDAARNPMRGSAVYCSSKAALEQIIRVIAREWMPHTRVNGVAPAVVEDTPMSNKIDATVPALRGWTPEEAKAYEMTQLPMKRRVEKHEIAEVVDHTLFGPAYQTGSIVHISGGK